ncbi:MAG: hypothetical protein A2081_01760 [Elusimicrobia bacterium GWC2_61_19]|nr:MAG: hypothetical protein A2081_01760 [Elusimicrobia bacterium GWC2_61_19]
MKISISRVEGVLKKLISFAGFLFICAPVSAEPLERLADRLQQGIEEYRNIKMAVLEFPYTNGKRSDGPAIVQERLTTLFAKNKRITLIERNLLLKVAGELKLQASGAMDEASTQKMGKLLGAEAVLTGTLNDLNDKEVEVNARVLLIQTAKIVSAEKITIQKTWKDPQASFSAGITSTEAMISRLDANEKYTFKTVNFKSGRIQRTYSSDKAVIAVEIAGKTGELLKRTRELPDSFYSEYYADGTLKTKKILVNSREYGPFKTFFPNGILQNEAYYAEGKLDGAVKIYNESGKLLFEQTFKNGIPDGYFKEYDQNGSVKSETFYKDGHRAALPDDNASAKSIMVKPIKLARGEEFVFYADKKYLCKITVDREFRVLSRQGQCPDGIARAYSKEGKLEKEFIFAGNVVSSLKIYDETGNVVSEKEYASKN